MDYQKGRVYSAEQSLRWFYDNTHDNTVSIHGVVLQLEPEARYGDLRGVQAYVDRVTALPSVQAALGRGIVQRVAVRERKTDHHAHYRLGTIAVHTQSGTRWAMRELVILHELAHHFTRGNGHGPEFVATFITLLDLVMGPQVAMALRVLCDHEGVEV